jgi:creatinine amidohydrolase
MLIEDLTSDKASKVIGKIDTLVLPVGTIEAHGPHCSIASDVIVPVKLAQEVEKLAGDRIFVAPIIPYGHTWHLKDFPGSHDVSAEVFCRYVFEVLRGFLEWKIKYIVIINGHGGNDRALGLAAEEAVSLGMKVVILDWWSGAFLEALREVIPHPEGHGGEGETSLVWNVGDKYVDASIIPKEDNTPRLMNNPRSVAAFQNIFDPDVNHAVFPAAYNGSPSKASRETGKRLNETAARLIVRVIDELRSNSLSKQ